MVRFDAMLALAERLGRGALVTGHYARIERDGEGPLLGARGRPRQGPDLHARRRSRPQLLERVRFPLGELTKPQVRELARAAGLAVADKKESQDLCFMAGTNRERVPRAPRALGATRRARSSTGAGRVLGRHRGHRHYTVGQRRGLGVAARRAALRARQGRRARTAWSSAPAPSSPTRA